MRKLFLTPIAIPALIVGFAFASKAQNKSAAAQGREALSSSASLYAEYCALCHGTDLNGGAAKSLSGDFEFVSKNKDIIALIKSGNETIGMPAFGEQLSDKEILNIIKYAKSSPKMQKVTPATNAKKIDPNLLQIDTWLSGLKTPWSLIFMTPDTALVTEVSGKLFQVIDGKKRADPVNKTPTVWAKGQGGLLDVAIDPDFAKNGWIYLSFSHPLKVGSDLAMTKIIRGIIVDNEWQNEQVLFEAKPEHYVKSRVHFGSRITFDDQGYLYFSIGDRSKKDRAQDVSFPNGKIHRILNDGRIPEDNPFVGNSTAYPSIFAYGNRNPQGLVYADGSLWETEHGPKGGDELNLIKKGANYGWPVISYGRNYNGTELTPYTHKEGMEQPVSQWNPSIAACGLDVYQGELFKDWNGYLLAGALRFEELRLIKQKNGVYVDELILLKDHGRVRDISVGPDGAIYVVLNEPGEILRLSPATVGEAK